MGAAQALYALQTTDIALETQRRRLAEVEASLGESDELREAREAYRMAQEALRQTQTLLRELELETKGLTDKIAQVEKHLYSGAVRNPKELKGMEADLHQWQRLRSGLEDRSLEAMLRLDEERAVLASREQALREIEATWQQSQAALQAERSALQTSLAQLEEKRQRQASSIPQADLAVYERLRQRLGRAVALLQGNACSGCGMTLATGQVHHVRMSQELVFCPNCERILAVSA
jgi:predicted  nucleic acid-binding Zn-ribbon protein